MPADDLAVLAVLAATVPGPSMRHYREELHLPVDPELRATVVARCRSVTGVPASS